MSATLAIRIFVPLALGYLLASVFRSISGVIAPHLVAELGFSAGQLGFATSAYFVSAVLLQVPYGMLLDRFDPRRLYAVFLVLCAAGAVMAASAEGLALYALGRGFIALGSAASAVTSYKMYATWFPADRLALMNGLSLGAGGLGVICGTTPVEVALQITDWRGVHLAVAGLLVAAALAVLTVVPASRTGSPKLGLRQQFAGLAQVLRSLIFWRAAPMLMMTVGSFGAFSSLWAGPWARDVAGFSSLESANLLLTLAVAIAASGVATGALVGLAARMGITLMGYAVSVGLAAAILIVFLSIQWIPTPATAFVAWALFGFLAMQGMVVHAALAPRFPGALVGRLNACLTLSWMLGGFVAMNLYGLVLDRFPAAADGGYAAEGHRLAMTLLAVMLVAALIWFGVATRLAKRRQTD